MSFQCLINKPLPTGMKLAEHRDTNPGRMQKSNARDIDKHLLSKAY